MFIYCEFLRLSPIGRYNLGRLFQSVESRTNNAAVGGSSPSSTTFCIFRPAPTAPDHLDLMCICIPLARNGTLLRVVAAQAEGSHLGPSAGCCCECNTCTNFEESDITARFLRGCPTFCFFFCCDFLLCTSFPLSCSLTSDDDHRPTSSTSSGRKLSSRVPTPTDLSPRECSLPRWTPDCPFLIPETTRRDLEIMWNPIRPMSSGDYQLVRLSRVSTIITSPRPSINGDRSHYAS